ncbi:copper chaperone PCu(A)C [Erythrobacter sp. Alg231-14]|uniref:copper chaperone PCu(A)C n=1 Tax=Erythrobacter sp. Alg231-14 TaxID=1922225 RepID=UPI000D55ECEC
MKRFTTGFAMVASLALAACGGEAETVEAPPEGVVPGLEVTDARLVLAPVAGNPAAVYFDVVYNGERGVSISGASVEGASSAAVHAMMEYNFEMTMAEAGPIALPAGEEKSFEPGGLHIMAFELGEGMEAGGTAEVTLNISGGARHKFDAEIRAAGEER